MGGAGYSNNQSASSGTGPQDSNSAFQGGNIYFAPQGAQSWAPWIAIAAIVGVVLWKFK